MYGQDGKIDYIEPTVSANTDTILMRATIPNPKWGPDRPGEVANRTLTDGEFVTVLVEGVEPVLALAVPARRGPVRPAGQLRLCRGQPEHVRSSGASSSASRRPTQPS